MKLVLLSGAHVHTDHYMEQVQEAPNMELVSVWDDMPERGQEIAQRMDCPFVPELGDAVGTAGAEVSIICADNAGHRPLLEASLQAGLDVFCEKPMALTVADADAMVAAVRESGRVAVFGYAMPFSGVMLTVKKLCDEGAIGQINQVRFRNAHHAAYARWFDSPSHQWFHDPARAGGGGFLDMGTHAVHLVRSLFGPFKTVQAVIGNKSGAYPTVDDFGIALTELASGVTGVVEAGWVMTAGRRGLEVLGSGGSIYLGEGVELTRWADGKAAETEIVSPLEDAPSQLAHLLAIHEGRMDRSVADADLDACRDAVAFMCAAYASQEEGTRQLVS